MQKFLFVGGSKQGVHWVTPGQPSVTFINGSLAEPSEDGSVDKTLNATVELYAREQVQAGSDEPFIAYLLEGPELSDSNEHLAALLKKFTPAGDERH